MIIPPIWELSVIGVQDPGVPNKERIVIRPTDYVDLSQFCVMLAWVDSQSGNMFPIQDHFFWLGNIKVAPPAWIFIYTGKGQFQDSHIEGFPDQRAIVMHWGKTTTLFHKNQMETTPVVIRLGGVAHARMLSERAPNSMSFLNLLAGGQG